MALRIPSRFTPRGLQSTSFTALAATLLASSPAMAHWPEPPSSVAFESPFGTLTVETSEYVYESRLYLNNKPIRPALQGLLDISYVYDLKDAHAALVAVSDGNPQCPVRYHWVVLKRNSYTVSPAFGSCSQQIKVSSKGARHIVATPSAQSAGQVDVYIYYDNRIEQYKRAATPGELEMK